MKGSERTGGRTRLVVSIGCPCGIGPEVAVAAAAKSRARVLLVGDLAALEAAARVQKIGVALQRVDDPKAAFERRDRGVIHVHQPTASLPASARRAGRPGRLAGAAQLAWIDAATDLAAQGIADALVTGPVSKDVIARSGARGARVFRGHTEHLAARLGASEVTMAFWSEQLTTSLVTTHLPLAAVPRAITAAEVARAIYWTARFIARLGKQDRPMVVAALNPHAGEGGLLGLDEVRTISPGIVRARKRMQGERLRVAVEGPVPAESAFRLAAGGAFSAVVAMYHDQATIPMKLLGFGEAVNVSLGMYHDQATIPMKLLGFGEAVNVSLGLPIVRTSVDHGTAYDRAGKGTADARGMIEAMTLAERLGDPKRV